MKPADLAGQPDFVLGPLSISPARRRIEGPTGQIQVEPLTMQVFLLLLDAKGQVVTRDTLFDAGWGGGVVGDDSLNRAINRVRRIASETGPDLFEIETIPRTGYRLLTRIGVTDSPEPLPARATPIPRRAVMAGAVVAATASAAGLGLWLTTSRKRQEFDLLISRGEAALDTADPASKPELYLSKAVSIYPDSARANGSLAYARALLINDEQTDTGSTALQEADSASRRALSLDPRESNARLARVLIQRSMLDFAATEDRLRNILSDDPSNIWVMRHLWALLQCVGRSRDSLSLIERALEIKPLAASCHYPRAQLLWILGRTAEADRVIEKALQYWPLHAYARYARFMIFAFTGRARAALAMLDDKNQLPPNFSPASIALWKQSLPALDDRSPAKVAAAQKANLELAKANLKLASQAVLTLSALNDLDAAFEVANAFFAVDRQKVTKNPISGAAWRFTPWLFTPPPAQLRADDRFKVICDGIGLSEYWMKRGVKPDYQLGIA